MAVAEVKQWEVNLSKKTGMQPIFADQNPMYQIDTYLSLTGLEWGVLSNGRIWRLLHKTSSCTLETYFEIDLLAALEQPDETKGTAVAIYFWLFFNQGSFRPDKNGRVFLTDALEQSRSYALALEADLRDNAYRSLEQLIIGFFAGDDSLDAADPGHRAQVYQNSLYLDASLEWNEDAFKGFVKLLVKKVSHLSDLVAVYRDHAPGVARLSQRLAATDRLIDQIVYQLYGLTAVEIAIVEGSGN